MTENKTFKAMLDLEQIIWSAKQYNGSATVTRVAWATLNHYVQQLTDDELAEYGAYRRAARAVGTP
jgi:hypothetical protein